MEGVDPSKEQLISSSSRGFDSDIFLWLAGNTKLGVIDFSRMEYDLVDGLGGQGVSECLPSALLSVQDGRKVLAVAYKKGSGACFLNYWQKPALGAASKVVTRPVEYLDSSSSRSLTQLTSSTRWKSLWTAASRSAAEATRPPAKDWSSLFLSTDTSTSSTSWSSTTRSRRSADSPVQTSSSSEAGTRCSSPNTATGK